MSEILELKKSKKRKLVTRDLRRGMLWDPVDSALENMKLPKRPLFPGRRAPEKYLFKNLVRQKGDER